VSDDFVLHPQLAADTMSIGDWPLCRLLLMNDDGWPWLILVPRRAGVRELHDLSTLDLARLTAETARVSAVFDELYRPTKINVGMLGNRVPQLHMHVIARYESDEAWPGPVWGLRPRRGYAANVLEQRAGELRARLL
jgi:diadenosine tetraphosphate (Ap4A) HIT family hydrolase